MISASLFQQNKKELKKIRSSQSEDDETPMHRKQANIIDFQAIVDQEEEEKQRAFQTNQKSLFAQFNGRNTLGIEEEDDSEHNSRSPKGSVKIRKLSQVREMEEPMAEPLAFNQRTPKDGRSPNDSPEKQNNIEESDSEYDIFSPHKSEQDEVNDKIQVDLDEKISKLGQEAAMIEKILPNFIINPFGQFRSYWGGLMILMLIYVIFILPVRLAFETNSSPMLPLDLTVDSIFFMDICFTFFTAYEDERGIVIVDFKKISLNYLKGWFFIDFISTFPTYLILDPAIYPGAKNFNSLLRFARLPRIYKLLSILRVGNLIKHQAIQKLFFYMKLNKEYTLILKFVMITLIVIHLGGCFWYFIGSVPGEVDNWITHFGLDQASPVEQYISSVFYVLTILVTVGYGNIVPRNNYEFIYTILFEFFGVAFFSYVMGTLTFTFAKLSQKLTMIKEREIFFNELAHTYSLPRETHERLLMSVENSIFSHSNQILELYTEEEIFQELPPLVQGQLCEFLFKDIIEKIRFLQGKPRGFLRKLFLSMVPVFLNKGDAIFFKGEPADFVYFVIRGRLVTKCEDQLGKIRTLIHVEGSYFGEVDILVSRARGETAIAEMSSEVWKIPKEHFLRLLNDFEDVKMEILDYAIKKEKSRKSTVKVQKNIKFLELLAKSRKEQVSLNKAAFIQKVKEKMVTQLNEIVKNKQSDAKELFQNTNELDTFLDKVIEYQKIKEKLQITVQKYSELSNTRRYTYQDPEVEESLLRGMKIYSHVTQIEEYM